MKIYDTSTNPSIAVVACQHGNEQFGLAIVDAIQTSPQAYPGVRTIIANEEAIKANTRYIDEDLNRVYPGNSKTKEGKLAYDILAAVSGCNVILDIHTTFADIPFVPIFTSHSDDVKSVLQYILCDKAIFIAPPMSECALVSHVFGGVSLEYGRAYAATPEGLSHALTIIKNTITHHKVQKKIDELYIVDKLFPLDKKLSKEGKDFVYNQIIQGFPCLLNEKAYLAAGYQCMVASRKTTLELSL